MWHVIVLLRQWIVDVDNAAPVSQENPSEGKVCYKTDMLVYSQNCQNVSSALCNIFCFMVIKGDNKTAVAEQHAVQFQWKVQRWLWRFHLVRYNNGWFSASIRYKSFFSSERHTLSPGRNLLYNIWTALLFVNGQILLSYSFFSLPSLKSCCASKYPTADSFIISLTDTFISLNIHCFSTRQNPKSEVGDPVGFLDI